LFVEFHDSFRIQPGNEIVNYLKTSEKQIAYYSTQVQHFNDLNCGHLRVDYIKEDKGRTKKIQLDANKVPKQCGKPREVSES